MTRHDARDVRQQKDELFFRSENTSNYTPFWRFSEILKTSGSREVHDGISRDMGAAEGGEIGRSGKLR